jgi:hypothetical protein
MISIPLTGEYQSSVLPASNQVNINCYVNIPQGQTVSDSNIYGTAGISRLLSSGVIKQANRGSHVKSDKPYFVNGEKLYRIDFSIDANGNEVFTSVELGTIPGNERCSFADNGKQLMVLVPNGNGYIIDESAGAVFQQITDSDFTANGAPQLVTFIDSFFIVTTDTKKFIKSAANDGLNWNALDFGSAEADPDNIVSQIVSNNRLYIGGSETIEVFENAGLGGFPFQRVNGFIVPKGVFAKFSMVNVDDTFMWVGGGTKEGAAIWQLSGTKPQKISTKAIDQKIQQFSADEIQDAFAWSYSQNGHFFVGFSFPDVAYVYDLSSGQWHQRQSRVVDTNGVTQNIRWRVNSIESAYGRLLVADSQDGRIGELSEKTYTEYGQVISRIFTTITVFNEFDSFSLSDVELLMQSGVGNQEKENPEVFLSVSDDGYTFGEKISSSVGKIGEYFLRQIWRRCGRFRRLLILKFEYSEPCKFAAVKLGVKIKSGHQRG